MDLEKEITKLEKYLIKEDRKEFILEMRRGTPQTRDAKLLSLAKHKQEIVNTMAKDEELKTINSKRSELQAPYNEQKRMNDKLSRFVHLIAKEEGD